MLVPVDISQHAVDKSSDIPEVDDERLDDNIPEGTDRSRSRDKRIRKWMHPYPLSMFRKQAHQRKMFSTQ